MQGDQDKFDALLAAFADEMDAGDASAVTDAEQAALSFAQSYLGPKPPVVSEHGDPTTTLRHIAARECMRWTTDGQDSQDKTCKETESEQSSWCYPCMAAQALEVPGDRRGDPEGRKGWMDRPTPTFAEAFAHVQRLAPEGNRETELALGIVSEALKAGQTAAADRDELAQRLEASLSLRAQEAQDAVRAMSVLHKDWALDLRKAAEGLDTALKKGHALATENAARWLEDDVLGPGNMSEWSRMPPYLHGRIRAGEHLARDLGQDPAKEPG